MTLTQYSLLNSENYYDTLSCDIPTILDKYILLINEYVLYLNEKILVKNKLYFQYIFTRGLETIINVFNGMLFYTKNVDLSYYHSQKAFYFYVEFIEQISDSQNSFLKLSSKDAIIFVYKKTLYEINIEFVKGINSNTSNTQTNSNINTDKMKLLTMYCNIYKSVALFFINNFDFDFNNKTNNILLFIEKNKHISEKFNYLIIDRTELHNISIIINNISYDTIYFEKFCEIFDIIIKKISKSMFTINTHNMNKKIYDEQFNNLLKHESVNKIINWIIE
jgi:hypothetical protein